MSLKVDAYCPCSMGIIFKKCPNRNLSKMGSVGVGFTINKGVKVIVSGFKTNTILFNGEKISFPTVDTVLRSLTNEKLKIEVFSSLPLGYGFGNSGASSLAASYAINKLLNLGKQPLELALSAHQSEIINNTGLGTVGTQITGGFLIKKKPGIPVIGKNMSFIGKKIYAIVIGKIETPTILNNRKKIIKINKSADKYLTKINAKRSISFEEIIDIAYDFATEAGLLNDKMKYMVNLIKQTGGHATMAIVGNVIISDSKPAINIKYHIEELTITDEKVHL